VNIQHEERVRADSPEPDGNCDNQEKEGEKQRLTMKELTAEQFQSLLKAREPQPELQTMVIVTLSCGLRISETRGLQWRDIDWLENPVTLERGVVKQDMDDVKTEESPAMRPLADDVIAALTRWKQASDFTQPEDWIFASPWKSGRQPVSYIWIWENCPLPVKHPASVISAHILSATLTAPGWMRSELRWVCSKK
jgi:integrase